MAIAVRCECGRKILAPESSAGRTGRCPVCRASIQIPGEPLIRVAEPAPAIRYDCPHCGIELEADAEYAGEVMECGGCRRKTVVPVGHAVARVATSSAPTPASRRGLIAPVLVSAAANFLLALVLFNATIPKIIGFHRVDIATLVAVTCVVELIFYSRSDCMTDRGIGRFAGFLGVAELAVGMFNFVTFACGVVLLINRARYLRARLA